MSRQRGLRELELLEALRSNLPQPGSDVITWVGDDAAVISTGGQAVVSTDQTVMGVHADPAHFDHAAFGARAVLGALSDICAMGSLPRHVLVALCLPPGTGANEALELISSAGSAASACGAVVVGGDISSGPVLSATVTVIGEPAPGTPAVRRDGARPGNMIGITGSIGGSAAGLAVLRGTEGPDSLAERHLRPNPRVVEGPALAEAGVNAMIDISDGIATDAAHIGRASGTLLAIASRDLPLDVGVDVVAASLGVDPFDFAATGGEDFELLFCADPGRREAIEAAVSPTRVTWIGTVEQGDPGCELDGRRDLSGWEHSFGAGPQSDAPSEPGPA